MKKLMELYDERGRREMNFEAKHLVRWGIPGWVFIIWILYSLMILKDVNPMDTELTQITKGLTLIISLVAIVVPLGYLLHQLYFAYTWVRSKKKILKIMVDEIGEKFPKSPEIEKRNKSNEQYFHFEFVWHTFLIEQEESKRTYIEARYRHLLSTIHGLGALFASLSVSLLITGLVAIIKNEDLIINPYY
jgi:hypothetical protein